jgi:hypothetical protein
LCRCPTLASRGRAPDARARQPSRTRWPRAIRAAKFRGGRTPGQPGTPRGAPVTRAQSGERDGTGVRRGPASVPIRTRGGLEPSRAPRLRLAGLPGAPGSQCGHRRHGRSDLISNGRDPWCQRDARSNSSARRESGSRLCSPRQRCS